ncbi:uncharacterized protein LOC141589746 [Silene latifolia]|uniref:uncharacterized protein LOC141589746 n=1 Tax=Silene latifolia TaxID=37657 RepID=UPI003D777602
MTNFMEAVDDCGLRYIDFEGYEFTYDNGQHDEFNRQSRIDRAMGSQSWMELFPRAKLLHLDREWSDHAPIMVVLHGSMQAERGRKKLFRFEQIWVGEDGSEEAIQRAWEHDLGDMMDNLVQCSKALQE